MRVWLVTVGEPLPCDPGTPRLLRTGILAKVLAGRGHAVTWWTSTFDHAKKVQRSSSDCAVEVDGITIRMLRGCGYPRNVSLQRLLDHELVAGKFRASARHLQPPSVILCSYPTIELAREVVRYGVRENVPVLVDIRDLWPDALYKLLPAGLRAAGRAIAFWPSVQATEVLRGCTGVLAVSEGYLQWGLRRVGRARTSIDGVYPLSYTIPEEDGPAGPAAGTKLVALGVDPAKTLVWYVGSFGRTYDLATVIRAARLLDDAGETSVQFVVSGSGDGEKEIRELVSGLRNVVLTGWIGAGEIAWLRRTAAIGLQPYADGAPQGLANKLFEYISAGLPVVSSLRGENETFLLDHGCGLNYDPGDARSLASQLQVLIHDAGRRREMGRRGRCAFDEFYSSEKVYGALASHLERVAANGGPLSRHDSPVPPPLLRSS